MIRPTPWRFSAHGKVAEVRGRAAEFFTSETGFIHSNLSWLNIRAANRVHEVIERYLGNRSNDEPVTVKASMHGIFAAPITVYPEPAPKYPMAQPVAKRQVPLTRKPARIK